MATYTYKATNNGYTATLTLTPGAQSVVDNTTVVAYKLTLTAGSNYFELWPIGWEIWLGGKQTSYQSLRGAPQKSISAGGTITLASGSTTITHNADGTKAAAIGFRVDGGDDASYLPGTVRYTGGETLPLPTIPRASGISLSASSVTLNGSAGSVTVTVSAHSTSFRHVAKLTFGSASAQISLAAGATSGTISLPMSMLSQIPNNVSGTATVTLTTYSGDTVIGTATDQLTITAGASIVPTISDFTATRVGQSALDMYVKGYDKARLRTTAAGIYGSTIRTYEVTGGLSGADVTTGVLWTAGTNSWTVKVTDSRGRTASKSVSVTVVDYATPSVSGASFERCKVDGTPDDDGTYLQVSAAISVASCGGKNSYTAKVQYKLQTASTWTDAGAFSGSSKLYDVGLSDMAYDVRIAVTDKLSTGYANATLDVGDVIMDYDPDTRTLDIPQSITFAVHGKALLDYIHPIGSYYWSDDGTDPKTLFGGTWERVKDRFLLAAGDTYSAGATGGEAAHTLTENEMPKHRHGEVFPVVGYAGWPAKTLTDYNVAFDYGNSKNYFTPGTTVNGTTTWGLGANTGYAGGGAAHNNMPPYRAVYVWRRTA